MREAYTIHLSVTAWAFNRYHISDYSKSFYHHKIRNSGDVQINRQNRWTDFDYFIAINSKNLFKTIPTIFRQNLTEFSKPDNSVWIHACVWQEQNLRSGKTKTYLDKPILRLKRMILKEQENVFLFEFGFIIPAILKCLF